jgi:hypothetical protein
MSARMKTKPVRMSARDSNRLFEKIRNWGRWGPNDARDTLNCITPGQAPAAATLVRSARSVSLSLPANTVAGPDNLHSGVRDILQTHGMSSELGEPTSTLNYLACECHGNCHKHIDAPCHIAYKGQLYNGEAVTCEELETAERARRVGLGEGTSSCSVRTTSNRLGH